MGQIWSVQPWISLVSLQDGELTTGAGATATGADEEPPEETEPDEPEYPYEYPEEP